MSNSLMFKVGKLRLGERGWWKVPVLAWDRRGQERKLGVLLAPGLSPAHGSEAKDQDCPGRHCPRRDRPQPQGLSHGGPPGCAYRQVPRPSDHVTVAGSRVTPQYGPQNLHRVLTCCAAHTPARPPAASQK